MAQEAIAETKVRVGLIDDHPVFRQGLAAVLADDARIDVVGEAGTATEALELVRRTVIDVAIVDILLPSVSGISLTSQLYEIQPSCRVLALSVIDEPCIIADMMRARACGYVLKTQPPDEIIDAIVQVRQGARYLPPQISAHAVDGELAGTPTRPFSRLTPRERQVFELLIRGRSNDEIAAALAIAPRTVETHRQRVMHKLSAHSVVQLQRYAARHGGL